jgi:replicative DNA helicase
MKTAESKHQASTGFQLQFLDSASFSREPYPRDWLVTPLFIVGQPGVIGGARKTLKTSLIVDLAISLGTGKPFLGAFDVPQQRRVAVLCGESGEATVQETAQRICAAKQVRLNRDCTVFWAFRLPQLSRPSHRASLRRSLEDNEIEVVFLDPLYLCLLGAGQGASAANLYEVGPLLFKTAQACLAAGATPILVHHTLKTARSAAKGDTNAPPPELNDLAFAGIAEFARQWLLIGRRSPYQPGSGLHQLALNVGGSAGQSGRWDVEIDEGVLGEDFKGRVWDVQARPHQGD